MDDARPRASGLTPREHEVLDLLAAGYSTEQIVSALAISVHTARNHVRNILTRLRASSRLEAVAVAARIGLFDSGSTGAQLPKGAFPHMPSHEVLLDAAPDAVVIIDTAGAMVFVNHQAERLFGYTRVEMIGRPVEMLIPHPARAAHIADRARYVADPQTRPMGNDLDLAARRKDGTEFPADISLSAIDTDDGPLYAAAVRDLTARNRTEALFRGLLESAPDAIVVVGADGRMQVVNACAGSLFGYTHDEMIGQPFELLVPDAARVLRPGQGIRDTGLQQPGRHKDGTEFPAEITRSAIESDEGLLVTASIRDGTERRQAAIVSASDDAFISRTTGGTITSWNAGAERMYGYTATEAIGRDIAFLIPEEARDDEQRAVGRVLNGEHIVECETVRLHSNGSRVEVAWTGSPQLENGVVAGISTIARDITERKHAAEERLRLEDRLSRSQRLESLGQLAGGVAHDFNNLLSVILSYTTFVTEAVTDNEAACADLQQIRIAAERAAGLTRQLLIFGRRETVQLQTFDLNAAVREVEALLARTLGEQIELRVDTASDLPPLRADRGQVEQVLTNLAVNARDAMPHGGTVTIETDEVALDDDAARVRANLSPGRHLTFSVGDSGTGMSPEVIERAFEPFFTTKARGAGTGLGLATVYGVVVEAGGAVVIDSEVGAGTIVRVYLPVADESPAPALASAPVLGAARRGNGEYILVVEDEAAVRDVALRMLSRNGYEVVGAGSGEAALAILEADRCDLLLTDVVMPGMSGLQLVERIRAHQPDLRVLYMSGYSQGVLNTERTLDESVALIRKPFDESALLEQVGSILELSQ